MTTLLQQAVAAAAALPPAEQDAVATRLLEELSADHRLGSIPDGAFDQLADELFQTYDTAEATDAAPAR